MNMLLCIPLNLDVNSVTALTNNLLNTDILI